VELGRGDEGVDEFEAVGDAGTNATVFNDADASIPLPVGSEDRPARD
jgi:hypothetical protein